MVRVWDILCFAVADSHLYDHFMPEYASNCSSGGCVPWASLNGVETYFAGSQVPSDAVAHCAMPSSTADGANEVDHSYAGPWCFCEDGSANYCSAPQHTVEQLNLQLARNDVIVASFVTYESLPGTAASAMFGESQQSMSKVIGMSSAYNPGDRKYIMHYVPFRNLKSGATYYYKVKSGGSSWTEVFSFRAPVQSGTTSIAMYGDMGVDSNSNIGNLKDDCESGAIDAIFHMGDHAYNLGDSDDKRGDAYMNAFSPTLRSCPWVPIIGNHESSDGDNTKRFQKIAEGVMIGEESIGFTTTADSALGHHLSLGSLFGRGLHSATPSGTSRYTSTDIGVIHVIALDTQHWDDTQKQWLEKDLSAANNNRGSVPWILVMNHYPHYLTSVSMHADASIDAYFSDEGEFDHDRRYQVCGAHQGKECETLGDFQKLLSVNLEPLLLKYNVDLYGAGHNHHYQATYPMKNGKECAKNYNNPSCPVYITEGNGGVPGRNNVNCHMSTTGNGCSGQSWCRINGDGCGAYGRVIATKTSLRYDHVENSNAKVIDTFTITKGPAPPPSPVPPPTPTPPTPTPAPTPPGSDTLKVGNTMRKGDQLESATGNAQFVLQSDGNLVLYAGGNAIWSAQSVTHGDHVNFQGSDGNLVLYDSKNNALWESHKHSGAVKVVLQDDCNLVTMDRNSKALWSLGTSCNSEVTV